MSANVVTGKRLSARGLGMVTQHWMCVKQASLELRILSAAKAVTVISWCTDSHPHCAVIEIKGEPAFSDLFLLESRSEPLRSTVTSETLRVSGREIATELLWHNAG
jgi:hypothetical protein